MEIEPTFDVDDVSAVYQTNDLSHVATEVYLEVAADMESTLFFICEMERDRVPDPFIGTGLGSAQRNNLLEDFNKLTEALELMKAIEETGSVPHSRRELVEQYPKALFRALENEMEEKDGEVDYEEIARTMARYSEQSED